MFDNKDREKRTPKEIKYSDRKLVTEKDMKKETNKGTNKETKSGGTLDSSDIAGLIKILTIIIPGLISLFKKSDGSKNKKGCGFGCLTVIVIFVVVAIMGIYLFSDTGSTALLTESIQEDIKQNESSGQGYRWLLDNNEVNPEKPYTIMIYLNGSDLETKYACATSDIKEMLDSNFNRENVNLLILTGGARQWHISNFSKSLSVYYVEENGLRKLADLGNGTIADVDLLSTYIDYGMSVFPAEKYGFIFWNHGGGTVYGYGADENYNGAGLSISDISKAFGLSGAKNKKFEFIGFDCCLMATIETAELLVPYAEYFIASEELEPGYGWNYKFLANVGKTPNLSGEEIGKYIVDSYLDFYSNSNENLTLSVVNLNKLGNLVDAFDGFGMVAEESVINGDFNTISKARKKSKSFGSISETAGYDLVDIKHLAENLKDEFPNEAAQVINAVEECVVYNGISNSMKNSYGLTTYVPYVGKGNATGNVTAYGRLGLFPEFTEFLQTFTEKLTGQKIKRDSISRAVPQVLDTGDIAITLDADTIEDINNIHLVIWKQLENGSDYFIRLGMDSSVEISGSGRISTMFEGYWPEIEGMTACLYEFERVGNSARYTVPAVLNGEDVNLIVLFDDTNPDGKILGAVPMSPEGSDVAPRYTIEIKKGDSLSLKYLAQLFLEDMSDVDQYTENEKWIVGDEIKVGNSLNIDVVPVDSDVYMYGFQIEDTQNNIYYTDFIEIVY